MRYDIIAEICKTTSGDKVTAAWIGMFASGRSRAPNVDYVQALYECLSGKKLF
jgi:hypothetical protein